MKKTLLLLAIVLMSLPVGLMLANIKVPFVMFPENGKLIIYGMDMLAINNTVRYIGVAISFPIYFWLMYKFAEHKK